MSERDVLREGLRELGEELETIEALVPEGLTEVALRLRKARLDVDLRLQEANGHRSHPVPHLIPDYPPGD
jgi:hypothetical protein